MYKVTLAFLYIYISKCSSLKVSIIGGGPAGLLAGISFAKNGHDVSIMEKILPNKKRKIHTNYLITKRGQNALNRFNIKSDDVFMDINDLITNISGKVTEEKTINYKSINRYNLIQSITNKTKEYKNISFEKDTLSDIDLKNKKVITRNGKTDYDILIGADGIDSRVRSILSKKNENFNFKVEHDRQTFQRFTMNKDFFQSLDNYEPSWDKTIHVWKGKSEILATPDINGNINGIIYNSPYSSYQTNNIDHFNKNLNLNLSRVRDQKYIYCSHAALDNIILIGDALHGVPNRLGQSINSALEDVVCVDRCIPWIEKVNQDYFIELYNSCRIEDAHSVCKAVKMVSDRYGKQDLKILRYIGEPEYNYSDIIK